MQNSKQDSIKRAETITPEKVSHLTDLFTPPKTEPKDSIELGSLITDNLNVNAYYKITLEKNEVTIEEIPQSPKNKKKSFSSITENVLQHLETQKSSLSSLPRKKLLILQHNLTHLQKTSNTNEQKILNGYISSIKTMVLALRTNDCIELTNMIKEKVKKGEGRSFDDEGNFLGQRFPRRGGDSKTPAVELFSMEGAQALHNTPLDEQYIALRRTLNSEEMKGIFSVLKETSAINSADLLIAKIKELPSQCKKLAISLLELNYKMFECIQLPDETIQPWYDLIVKGQSSANKELKEKTIQERLQADGFQPNAARGLIKSSTLIGDLLCPPIIEMSLLESGENQQEILKKLQDIKNVHSANIILVKAVDAYIQTIQGGKEINLIDSVIKNLKGKPNKLTKELEILEKEYSNNEELIKLIKDYRSGKRKIKKLNKCLENQKEALKRKILPIENVKIQLKECVASNLEILVDILVNYNQYKPQLQIILNEIQE